MAYPTLRRPRVNASLLTMLTWAGCLMATAAPITSAHAASPSTGSKGADIYCFMRTNGNSHQVSWEAAYAVIKRQSVGLFKTSPEHAAVMITETVVEDPGGYPECGRYLGDLYKKNHSSGPAPTALDANPSYEGATGAVPPTSRMTRDERYGY